MVPLLLLASLTGAQDEPTVPQTGRIPESTVQRGIPQTGRTIQGQPQRNPDGSTPRTIPPWRPPVTIIYGQTDVGVIPYPFQFNLPAPAYGLVWRRISNDAVLYDTIRGTIIEVRQRWFG